MLPIHTCLASIQEEKKSHGQEQRDHVELFGPSRESPEQNPQWKKEKQEN